MDTADFAITTGFTPGLSVAARQRLRIVGSVVRSKTVDATSPIAYGYTDNLAIWCDNGPIFNVSSLFAGGGGRRLGGDDSTRPTGRGTPDDPDVPQARLGVELPAEPKAETWQAMPVTDEQLRNGINVIPPSAGAGHPALCRQSRFARVGTGRERRRNRAARGGGGRPARQRPRRRFLEQPDLARRTQGSYFLVFNALLNYDRLDAGRKLDAR
jgi:hypothetical protein